MARLGDICTLVNGYAFKPTDWKTEGLPIIRIQNLNDTTAPFNYFNGEIDRKYVVNDGDLLFSWSGTPGTSFGAFFWRRGKGVLNQHIFNVYPVDGINKAYLRYALNGNISRIIDKAHGGVGLQHITKKELVEIDIPILSEEQQKQIVIVLDSVDKLIVLRKEQLAKLDQLVKSRFMELFGDPETNPMGWKRITVQQAINEKIIDKPLDGNHGGKHPKTSDYVPTGVPFIMANNLVDGHVDLEHCAFISKKQADSLDKGFAKDGDVLITHKGTIGRTAILHCSYPYIMLTPQVTYYRPISGIIPEYLKAYFDTDYFQGIIGNIASVGSTRAYIGITAQQELPLLIPEMEKQKEYTAFVEQTDKSKLAIQQSLDKLELLKKSLMQEYFG